MTQLVYGVEQNLLDVSLPASSAARMLLCLSTVRGFASCALMLVLRLVSRALQVGYNQYYVYIDVDSG